ncbi:MAG: glycosyltransferase family 4 protein [Actinomycetota bacterium]
MSRVDLLVPELAPHDATGTHTLLLRDLLVEMGAEVRFVTQVPAEVDEPFTLADDWRDPAPTVVLQHGIGSFVADAAIKRRVPVVVNYHNITPIEFVEPWTPELISGLRWGRSQLDQLAPLAVRGIGVSGYNAAEMRAVGFDDVRVAPVLWRLTIPDAPVATNDASPTVLFVGRVAANKCHEDLLAAFALVHERRPDCRLALVGAPASDDYQRSLDAYATRLGIREAVDFTGSVSQRELLDRYRHADVFLCLSEHEGFCVPIVEAMAAGVPVVAHAAAAVPETVADAGILLADKRPATVAAAVLRVLDDAPLAATLVDAGRRRAAEFDLEIGRERMRAALEGLVG